MAWWRWFIFPLFLFSVWIILHCLGLNYDRDVFNKIEKKFLCYVEAVNVKSLSIDPNDFPFHINWNVNKKKLLKICLILDVKKITEKKKLTTNLMELSFWSVVLICIASIYSFHFFFVLWTFFQSNSIRIHKHKHVYISMP